MAQGWIDIAFAGHTRPACRVNNITQAIANRIATLDPDTIGLVAFIA